MSKEYYLSMGNKVKKTRNLIVKIIVSVLIIAIFINVLLFLQLKYEMSWKKTKIAEYRNDDNGYTLLFEQKGEPFLFGPHTVKLTLSDEKGKKLTDLKAELSNDGAGINDNNARVKWCDNWVEVTLSGCEQKDKTYVLYY